MPSIFSKILVWVLGILLGVALVFNVIQYIHNVSLTHTISSLTEKNKTLADQLDKCNAASENQNKEISNAKNKSITFQKELDDTNKKLHDQQQLNANLIDRLKSQPAPKSCKEITNYINSDKEIYKW